VPETLPLYVVDAFTVDAFRGNPAGVVLGHGSEAWMQALAAEMRHAETAYARPRGDDHFDLRWFTPEVEVRLCGHATLATAHVLYTTGAVPDGARIVFHTRGGELAAARRADGSITLDFPITEPAPTEPKPELFAALGIEPGEFLHTDGDWYLCVVDDAATVRKCAPDFRRLAAIDDVGGVYVTALADDDPDHDIVSRCFAPKVGIDEDFVTGSMHCVLIAYWGARLGRDELRAHQASARGGELAVTRAGDRALLTGHAVTVLSGSVDA